MKKKIFAALVIMMGVTMGAMAQNTANIKGKAEVMQAIKVVNKVDLNFGSVSQGAIKTIGLTNNVTGLPNHGTQKTGLFLVSAAATTIIDLEFNAPPHLVKGDDKLTIDTYTYGWDVTDDYATGKTLVSGGDVLMPTNVVETVNGIYVFVGATVKPAADQAIGVYAADITLTATYN